MLRYSKSSLVRAQFEFMLAIVASWFVAAFASDGHARFFLDLLRRPDARLEKAQRLACQCIGALSRQFGALKFDSYTASDTAALQQLTISEEIGQLKVCRFYVLMQYVCMYSLHIRRM